MLAASLLDREREKTHETTPLVEKQFLELLGDHPHFETFVAGTWELGHGTALLNGVCDKPEIAYLKSNREAETIHFCNM